MAILTKAQLEALNQSSFPDQSTEAITPAILRNYNTQTIDTLVDSLDTGSFTTDAEFNAFTSSTNSSITQLNASSASQQVSINALNGATSSYATSAITASSLITASVNLNTITFTKGNGSTFDITVNTGSGGGTTDISSLNAFTASQLTINSGLNASTASQQISIDNLNTTTASINSSITQLNASSASQQISINALNTNSGSVNSSITQLNASSASQQISINALSAATASYVTSAITASSLITASVAINVLTFTKGDGTQFNLTVASSGSVTPGTISGSAQITELGFVSSSVTASSLITASFSGNTLTFTKGDASTFGVVIPDVSGSGVPTGTVSSSAQIVELGFLQTSSFNSYTSSTNSRLTNIESTTASLLIETQNLELFSASALISISNLNASSASQQISIDALNTTSASLNTSASLGLTTASFSGNTLTFTKGNGTTFGVVIPDVSGSTIPAGTVSSSAQILNYGIFATTGSNTFVGSQTIKNSLAIEDPANPLVYTQIDQNSVNGLLQFYQNGGNGYQFNNNVQMAELTASLQQGYVWVGDSTGKTTLVATSSFGGGGSVPAGTISGSQQITDLGFVSSSVTASSLVTASFSGNTLTFTKGDGATFGVVIPDVSGSTGNFATTGSNVFVGNQTISGSLFVSGSEVITGTLSASALRVENNTHLDGTLRVTNDAQFDGHILIQGTSPHLKLRDTSGGGGSAGYDVRVDTGSFEIHDDTHNRNVLSDIFNSASAQHTTSLTSEIIVISGSTSVTLIGNVSASIISASTINGLGDPLAFSASVDSRINAITASGGIPAGTISGSQQITDLGFVSSSVTASSLVTASFSGNTLTFTKGDSSTFGVVIPDVSGSTIDTGSFATTGSNVFTGDQTLSDEAGNTVTLSDISGSLVLVAKGSTSGSAGLSHITSSANQVNLIFKSANTQSGSLTISGSNNILVSPATPTDGFVRYLTNNNIALNSNSLPQITGSAAYSPNVSSNLLNGLLTFRGPASSSAWNMRFNTLQNASLNIGSSAATSANQAIAGGTMDSNILLSSVNYNAYTTPLVTTAGFNRNLAVGTDTVLTAFSSSISSNSNIFNGNSFAVNNSYFGTASTAAAQRLALTFNVLGGINSSRLTASGSNTNTSAPREVIANTTNGSGILLGAVLNGDNSNLYSTLVHGSNLTVTGSSAYNTYQTAGGAFIGRNNSVNGTAASSGETIFAVGTGTSTSVRKTGFLIDSGSNTFIEGTLNVSGASSLNGAVNITGSLTSSLTQGYVWVGGAGNVSTLVATSSFSGVTSAITASSLITASVNLNTITFTKGDSSTFNITVDTGSGGGGSVPAGTVSSSAQILAYNKFATTGSNTFNAYQIIRSNLAFQEAEGAGGSDNNINLSSLNQSTLYIQNTSVSTGYNSGSVLQLTTATGSNGYGGSGSAVFQMDALYEGNRAAMKVGTAVGLGSYVQGYADKIEFAKSQGFPNTPATSFKVDAASIELSGSIKVNTGSSGSAGIVSVGSGGATVNNGLVTANSIILVTTQNSSVGGDEYPAVVGTKSAGSFTVSHNYGGTLEVGYLIINPIT